METSIRKKSFGDIGLLVAAVLFIVTYFIARGLLETVERGTPWSVVSALLPVVPCMLMLLAIARGLKELDELERRIQLEALAFAYPLAFMMLMTLGLLEIAIELPPEDLSYRHVWAFLPVFYFLGLFLAKKRYA